MPLNLVSKFLKMLQKIEKTAHNNSRILQKVLGELKQVFLAQVDRFQIPELVN